KRVVPKLSSSAVILRPTVGWLMRSRRAAPIWLPASTTAKKVRYSSQSNCSFLTIVLFEYVQQLTPSRITLLTNWIENVVASKEFGRRPAAPYLRLWVAPTRRSFPSGGFSD